MLVLFGIMVGAPCLPSTTGWTRRYGYDVDVVGAGVETFVPFCTNRLMLDHVSGIPADCLVFYLDCLDAFVCEDPQP